MKICAAILITVLVGTALTSRAWAQPGDKSIGLGYAHSTMDAFAYGITVGTGLEMDDSTEARLDIMYLSFNTTWDASIKSWSFMGKDPSTAHASIFAGLVGARAYLTQDFKNILPNSMRPFIYGGLGYYVATWTDIQPEDGQVKSFGFAPGLGIQYLATPHIGLEADLKYHVLFKGATEDFSTVTLDAFYRW